MESRGRVLTFWHLLTECPLLPARIAPEFLRGTKPDADFETDEAPLIVFINARSGGRLGPELAKVLAHAVGSSQVCCHKRILACCNSQESEGFFAGSAATEQVAYILWSPVDCILQVACPAMTAPLLSRCMLCLPLLQVYDLSQYRPDKVLSTIWANLREQEQQGNQRAAVVRSRLRILACGGDGTVAWIFKVIRELDLQPPPPVAIMPLGTGRLLLCTRTSEATVSMTTLIAAAPATTTICYVCVRATQFCFIAADIHRYVLQW